MVKTRTLTIGMAALLAIIILAGDAPGQTVKKQVLAAVSYVPTGFMGNTIPPGARQEAELLARKKALASYMSDVPPARRNLLEKMASSLLEQIEAVVPHLQVLDERIDKAAKRLEISAAAEVDVGKIESMIAEQHSEPVAEATPSEERAPMVFIFIARKIGSITTSDGKRVEFVKTAKQQAENENSAAGSKGISVDYSMEDLSVKEYGGKSIDKAQEVEWIAESVGAVDSAINEVFTQAGYECVDAVDVEGMNVSAFREDYGAGDDVQPATRQAAIRTLRGYEVGCFATGRMDISLPAVHEVSGLPQVYVKVEAKVTDIRSPLPKTVASVAGEYYQGVGPNVQVATQNALLSAAQGTARKLVDQLRSKGL